MLDIISMITFLLLFIGLPIILIIIGGNAKTEEEQRLEDEEQMEYLRHYREKRLNKKRGKVKWIEKNIELLLKW